MDTMSEDLSQAEIAKELTNILTELLNVGNWQSSLFLRAASKRIQVLLEEAKSIAELEGQDQSRIRSLKKFPPNYIPIYVSLYQVAGNNLQNWQYTLRLLSEHSVNRPTYRDEQSVRALIASKTDIDRHGYAIVYIKEDDIYGFEEQPRDSLGHEMLVLKEGVVKLENIVGFVHANGKRYILADNVLVAE